MSLCMYWMQQRKEKEITSPKQNHLLSVHDILLPLPTLLITIITTINTTVAITTTPVASTIKIITTMEDLQILIITLLITTTTTVLRTTVLRNILPRILVVYIYTLV